MDFISSKALSSYAESRQPVKYILDVMKLDVPNLFTAPQSVPGEKLKEHLHSYIASNGLSRELLKNVDTIMVSLCLMLLQCNDFKCTCMCALFGVRVSEPHTCSEK